LDSPVFIVKPYSTKELCSIYGVSPKTFFRWLLPFTQQIGKRNGRMYTVRQIEIIIGFLGVPYAYREKETFTEWQINYNRKCTKAQRDLTPNPSPKERG
jgi:hypothetical protein